MSDVLCLVLTQKTDLVGGTAVFYGTTAKEYIGAGAPGVFQPLIVAFANIDRNAFDDGTTFGEITVSPGSVQVANPAGALDALLTYGGGTAAFYVLAAENDAWANRKTLLVADVDHVDDDQTNGVLTTWLSDGRAAAEAPFETTFYDGSNVGAAGVQGTASDLKGKPIVNCLGYGFQCPVPYANGPAQIVQLDKIRINDLPNQQLYDGLVPITRGNVYVTLAALQAAATGAGTFDLYKGDNGDGAYAKLGTTPKYNVTADIQGQARGGTFRTLPGDLFKEVIEQRAGGTTDAANVAAINAAMPYALGLWLDQPVTCRDVLNRIAQSILGFWGRDLNGIYKLLQLVDPAGQASIATFEPVLPLSAVPSTSGDIVSLVPKQASDPTRLIPVSDVTVTYAPRGVVTDLGFDTNSTPAQRAAAAQAALSAKPTVACTNWVPKYPASQGFTLETWLATEAGAKAVADAAKALFNVEGRRQYIGTFALRSVVNAGIDLGSVITVKFPRYGFNAGKKAAVLGMKYRGFATSGDAATIACRLFV